MFLRFALILSLIAQQTLAFSCCGVQIIRPDIVRPDCRTTCAVSGPCQRDADSAANQVYGDSIQGACGDGAAAMCASPSACTIGDDTSPCESPCEQPTDCAPPVDHKKQGPDVSHLDVVAGIAHPALPAIASSGLIPATAAARLLPRWPSNHLRQAALAVWLI
jgi:hypothetical protein